MASPTETGQLLEELLEEIEHLKQEVSAYRSRAQILASTIISSTSTAAALFASTRESANSLAFGTRLDAQKAHNQQSLYRTCASITTFRARDPDPHAIASGHILGLRFEVVLRARFQRPYYVLLNRPYQSAAIENENARKYWRVHKHTVPVCIPLAALAVRWLPGPGIGDGEHGTKEQDLGAFVRALRREIVRYHNRIGAVQDLRKAAGSNLSSIGVGEDEEGKPDGNGHLRLADVAVPDAEGKLVALTWRNGQTGRLVLGDDGDIRRLVVFSPGFDVEQDEPHRPQMGRRQRDHGTARKLLHDIGLTGGPGKRKTRVDDLVRSLEVGRKLPSSAGGDDGSADAQGQ